MKDENQKMIIAVETPLNSYRFSLFKEPNMTYEQFKVILYKFIDRSIIIQEDWFADISDLSALIKTEPDEQGVSLFIRTTQELSFNLNAELKENFDQSGWHNFELIFAGLNYSTNVNLAVFLQRTREENLETSSLLKLNQTKSKEENYFLKGLIGLDLFILATGISLLSIGQAIESMLESAFSTKPTQLAYDFTCAGAVLIGIFGLISIIGLGVSCCSKSH